MRHLRPRQVIAASTLLIVGNDILHDFQDLGMIPKTMDYHIKRFRNHSRNGENAAETVSEHTPQSILITLSTQTDPSPKKHVAQIVGGIKCYQGLDNLGATCYINSVVQQLFHHSQFLFTILETKDIVPIPHEYVYLTLETITALKRKHQSLEGVCPLFMSSQVQSERKSIENSSEKQRRDNRLCFLALQYMFSLMYGDESPQESSLPFPYSLFTPTIFPKYNDSPSHKPHQRSLTSLKMRQHYL